MGKKALIFWGGWLGHEPEQVAEVFRRTLANEGFEVEVSDTLESLEDVEKLKALHLLVPVWTMREISQDQVAAVNVAIANGTGIAGCHGGMCDAFRDSVQWQFITGGNWVAHPGGDGVEYVVNIKQSSSPLVAGISDFKVASEQYYLHVDPAVEVLATTRFPTVTWYHSPNGAVDMPVVWTKRWGLGRVYYNSLGHHADIFDIPEALELMRRGLLWAAEGKDIAIEQGLDASIYESDKKMF
jgi:type 1 glutamine amidotransferase